MTTKRRHASAPVRQSVLLLWRPALSSSLLKATGRPAFSRWLFATGQHQLSSPDFVSPQVAQRARAQNSPFQTRCTANPSVEGLRHKHRGAAACTQAEIHELLSEGLEWQLHSYCGDNLERLQGMLCQVLCLCMLLDGLLTDMPKDLLLSGSIYLLIIIQAPLVRVCLLWTPLYICQ